MKKSAVTYASGYPISEMLLMNEDIIDKYIIEVEEEEGNVPKKAGFKACLRKYFCIYKQASKRTDLYAIGKDIQELKDRLDEINRNREVFRITNIGGAGEGSSTMNEGFKLLRRTKPYDKDDGHVVGFKEDAELLTSELLKKMPDRSVISIVGMGGVGKTTIARKLYGTSSVREKFDCSAWVCVSQDYNIRDLLRIIIKSFKWSTSKEELEVLEKMDKEDLEFHLRDFLKESRYLVVIDDVWDTDIWESLRRALPDNDKKSRVIITTRDRAVAEYTFGTENMSMSSSLYKKKKVGNCFVRKCFRTMMESMIKQAVTHQAWRNWQKIWSESAMAYPWP